MTLDQRKVAEKHVGLANYLARKHGGADDEWCGVAQHAMCIAVIAFRPSMDTKIETWISRCVKNAILQVMRSKYWSQETIDLDETKGLEARKDGPTLDQLVDRLVLYKHLARSYWIEKVSAKQLAWMEGLTIRELNVKLERLRRMLVLLIDDCAEMQS